MLTSSSPESDSEVCTNGLSDVYEPIFDRSQLSQLTVLVMVLQFVLRSVSYGGREGSLEPARGIELIKRWPRAAPVGEKTTDEAVAAGGTR